MLDSVLGTPRSLETPIISQLFSFIYEIITSFEGNFTSFDNPPVGLRAIFLDILKAFDKVWQGELIYKMYGIEREVIHLDSNYLDGCMQRAVSRGWKIAIDGDKSPGNSELCSGVTRIFN